jgi:hypothetical protein
MALTSLEEEIFLGYAEENNIPITQEYLDSIEKNLEKLFKETITFRTYDPLDLSSDHFWKHEIDESVEFRHLLSKPNMWFFKSFISEDNDTSARAAQIIELSTELIKDEILSYPIVYGKTIHPGLTIVQSCRLLNKTVPVIHISTDDEYSNYKIQKEIHSLEDLASCYKFPIRAKFDGRLDRLQIFCKNISFKEWGPRGDLDWKSRHNRFKIEKFFKIFNEETMGKSTERLKFKYQGRNYKIFIPWDTNSHSQILKNIFERSYQNIGYEPYQ